MLQAEYLEDLPEEIIELFSEVETEILAEMARRISKYDFWLPSVEYQNERLLEAGVLQSDILRALSAVTRKSDAALRRLMQKAGTLALHTDEKVYSAAGMTVPAIRESEGLKRILNSGYAATAQTMKNLCRTTANTATRQFENALDRAWLKVTSGAFSSESAVRSAVKELSERGLQSIRYASGRTDSIETAVRRAVLTGASQTAGKLSEELAEELGCDLMELTAHPGARPEHAVWQGKIVSRSGAKGYLSLSDIGYGTPGGFKGVNCRHDWGPYVEGEPRTYTDEQLAEMDAPKYEYNGKKLTEYEAQQQQRYNERQIRRWKREYVALYAAGLDTSEAAVKLRSWQAQQNDFLSKTDLKSQYSRENVGMFSKKHSTSANREAEEFYRTWSKSIGSNDAIKTLAKYYDVKYNDSPRYKLLQTYVRSVKSGMLSPLSHFDLYEEYYHRIQSEIVGKEINGKKISGQSDHFLERVFGCQRDPKTGTPRNGVQIQDLIDCISNPEIITLPKEDEKGRTSFIIMGHRVKVSINAETYLLIQINPWRD